MKEFKVYLAGPITGYTVEGCTTWRDYAKQELARGEDNGTVWDFDSREDRISFKSTGIVGYSPMRAKDYLTEVGVLSGHPSAYDEYILSSAKGILYRDHWDCRTADAILVNLMGATAISVGTVMEIAFGFAYNTPVVIAMEDDNIHHHAMLDTAAGWIAPDLDYAINIVKAILLPDGIKVAA